MAAGLTGKETYKLRSGITFEVDAPRYEVLKKLGQGAYGCLADAIDKRTGERVAIKKVANAFVDEQACKLALREVRLLRHFQHENVLCLLDIMTPPLNGPWNDLYIVLERCDADLHFVIHSGQTLSSAHIQWFMYQLLRGVKAIHSAKALHRDLKPSNLLVNKNCELKICDFGLARGVDESRSPLRRRGGAPGDEPPADADDVADNSPSHAPLTEYVVTRWYRAPVRQIRLQLAAWPMVALCSLVPCRTLTGAAGHEPRVLGRRRRVVSRMHLSGVLPAGGALQRARLPRADTSHLRGTGGAECRDPRSDGREPCCRGVH